MKTKVTLFALLCLPLLITACGKGDTSAAGTGPQVVSSNAVSTAGYNGTYFPPIENEYGSYYVSYSFFESGCYTGRQHVRGYDQESTRRQLCERLQDDWAHRGCARGMRRAYFSSMCNGTSAWNPR